MPRKTVTTMARTRRWNSPQTFSPRPCKRSHLAKTKKGRRPRNTRKAPSVRQGSSWPKRHGPKASQAQRCNPTRQFWSSWILKLYCGQRNRPARCRNTAWVTYSRRAFSRGLRTSHRGPCCGRKSIGMGKSIATGSLQPRPKRILQGCSKARGSRA